MTIVHLKIQWNLCLTHVSWIFFSAFRLECYHIESVIEVNFGAMHRKWNLRIVFAFRWIESHTGCGTKNSHLNLMTIKKCKSIIQCELNCYWLRCLFPSYRKSINAECTKHTWPTQCIWIASTTEDFFSVLTMCVRFFYSLLSFHWIYFNWKK